jgi:hypothetical protein
MLSKESGEEISMLDIINQAVRGEYLGSPERGLSEIMSMLLIGIDDLPEEKRKFTEECLIRVLLHKVFRAVQVGDQQAAIVCVDTNEGRQEIVEGWDLISSMVSAHDVTKMVDNLIDEGECGLLFVDGWPKLISVTT